MNDIISRQEALEALEREKTYCTAIKGDYIQTDYFKQYNMGLTDGIKALDKLQPATMYGYNIDHLLFIASILKEKNIPPENVADMVKDVGRVIQYAIDSFNASIEKTIKDQMTLPEPPKQEENGTE